MQEIMERWMPLSVGQHLVNVVDAPGALVSRDDLDWLLAEVERLAGLVTQAGVLLAPAGALLAEVQKERDEARTEVERLTGLVTTATVEAAKAQKERDEARAALAEPSDDEEMLRLMLLIADHTGVESRGAVRAILADRRQRVGVP